MSRLPAFIVSTGPMIQDLSGIQDLLDVALVLWSCVPAFLPALSLCLWCAMLEYGSISRFKGVFRGFCGVRVGLCCLGALRGLWGFCARVELGGYKTCGVFASVFLLLCPLSCLFVPVFAFFYALCLSSGALPLLSSACHLSLWVVVSFSLSDKTKKERICFALFLYLVLVFLF